MNPSMIHSINLLVYKRSDNIIVSDMLSLTPKDIQFTCMENKEKKQILIKKMEPDNEWCLSQQKDLTIDN